MKQDKLFDNDQSQHMTNDKLYCTTVPAVVISLDATREIKWGKSRVTDNTKTRVKHVCCCQPNEIQSGCQQKLHFS